METEGGIHTLNYRKLNNAEPLRALVDVEIDGWIIKALRVTQKGSRKPYISMSKSAVLDPSTGRTNLEQALFLPDDLWFEVEVAVLKMFDQEEGTGEVL